MIKSSRKPLLSVGRATAKWGLVWAMPRFAPISACSSPPWNIPQGRGWCRRDTKLIDLHWTPQSCCHQGYSRKALRFHLQHLSVSSVYVKSHRKKTSNQTLWLMQDADMRELHKVMNNYITPTTPQGSAAHHENSFSPNWMCVHSEEKPSWSYL